MSFARAAAELNVTPGALSFQIKSLETRNGHRMGVHRGTGLGRLAFQVRHIGVKRGEIRSLGVANCVAPLLSTLAPVLAGPAAPAPKRHLAAALFAGGAALAPLASARTAKPITSRSGG